jgi:hypothetical protein
MNAPKPRVDILVSKDVLAKAGGIFGPHVCPWGAVTWLRDGFPADVKALVQIPLVV